MSAISQLQANIAAYPEAFRLARSRAGLTNAALSDLSGVPYSTVRNAQSGNGGVTVEQAAALALVLHISLDELFCIPRPEEDRRPAEEDRLHALELELAERNGELAVLRSANSSLAAQYRTCARIFSFLSVVLCFVVMGYLFWDFRIAAAGLIVGETPTLGAWLLLLIIGAAVFFSGRELLHTAARYTNLSSSPGTVDTRAGSRKL